MEPDLGEIVINAVVRAAAIDSAILHDDETFTFVWAANAPEQIEAALAEAGWQLTRITPQPA